MKKRMIAVLCAALFACTALCTPASATSKYKKGDVNMDGTIDLDDAMTILQEYVNIMILMPCSLTDEQIELAAIVGPKTVDDGQNVIYFPFAVSDAAIVLHYYTESKVVGLELPDDIVEYYQTTPKFHTPNA